MIRKKKYLAVLALLLVAAMVSTATLAYAPQNGKTSVQSGQHGGNSQNKQTKNDNAKPNGNKGNTQDQEKSDQDEQKESKGQKQKSDQDDQNTQGKPKQGQKQKDGQDEQKKSNQSGQKKSKQGNNNQGKPDNRKESLNIEEIKASIAAVTNVSTQSSLTALLKAYETALANQETGRTSGVDKQTMKTLEEAVEAAHHALTTALADAGIAVDQNKSNGVGKGPQGPKHFDLATIEAAIAKLNNPDLQASLTALVKAYKTALANEQSGLNSGADEATMAAYRKLVEEAKAAVLKALTGAKIASGTATPSSLPKGQQKKLLNVDAIQASIATVDNVQTQASLTALTEAYQTAVSNMESAWGTADDATLKTYREAAEAAQTALLDALNSAGIETAATPSSIQKPPQEQRVTGIWVAVVNWFSNLFGKLFK